MRGSRVNLGPLFFASIFVIKVLLVYNASYYFHRTMFFIKFGKICVI